MVDIYTAVEQAPRIARRCQLPRCNKRLSAYNDDNYCRHHSAEEKSKHRAVNERELCVFASKLMYCGLRPDGAAVLRAVSQACGIPQEVLETAPVPEEDPATNKCKRLYMSLLYYDALVTYKNVSRAVGYKSPSAANNIVQKFARELVDNLALQDVILRVRELYQTPV